MPPWWFKVTLLRWLSDTFKGISKDKWPPTRGWKGHFESSMAGFWRFATGIFRQIAKFFQVFSKAFRSRGGNWCGFVPGCWNMLIRSKMRPFRMEHNNKRPTSSWTFVSHWNTIPRYKNSFYLNIDSSLSSSSSSHPHPHPPSLILILIIIIIIIMILVPTTTNCTIINLSSGDCPSAKAPFRCTCSKISGLNNMAVRWSTTECEKTSGCSL